MSLFTIVPLNGYHLISVTPPPVPCSLHGISTCKMCLSIVLYLSVSLLYNIPCIANEGTLFGQRETKPILGQLTIVVAARLTPVISSYNTIPNASLRTKLRSERSFQNPECLRGTSPGSLVSHRLILPFPRAYNVDSSRLYSKSYLGIWSNQGSSMLIK
jgi:hypothetical protein